MVQLIPGTPLFDDIFGGASRVDTMTSGFPSYGTLQSAFTDPAIRKLYTNAPVLNALQLKDIQRGARFVFDGLAVIRGNAPTGLPSFMLGGLKKLVHSADLPSAIADSEVFNSVMNAKKTPQGVAGALLGTALASMGVAAPVVGIIAGLVVALAGGIYRALQAVGVASNKSADVQRELQYRLFPKGIQGGSDTDAFLINTVVRPALESSDWSALFMPRYKGEWLGLEREGGYEFAPGKASVPKEFGSAGEEFIPTDGLGCVPGTATITGIIQVNLPHGPPSDRNTLAKEFYGFLRGGRDPRTTDSQGVQGKTRVFDTGDFYPTTARLCGLLWTWAMQEHNPLCFRIDARKIEDPWRAYCESGLEFIRKVCYPWAYNNLFNAKYKFAGEKNKDAEFYAYNPNADFEGYYGTAIFHAIGAFICTRPGDLSHPPKYEVQPSPYGILGSEIGVVRAYGAQYSPVWSSLSGPWLPIIEPKHWPDQCMGTRYDRGELSIKKAIQQLRDRQRWNLKHSPVAVMSCREQDVAFKGPSNQALLDQLRQSRAILLKNSARFALNLDDAAADEPGLPDLPGSWRDQLKAAGVTPGDKLGHSLEFSAGSKQPVPEAGFVPGGSATPWNPRPTLAGRPYRTASAGGGTAGLVGLGALFALGAGAYLMSRRRRR